MAYTKRLFWALIVFSIITLLPSEGWCIRLDPYEFHVIRGTLSLEYEREHEKLENSEENTTSTFIQRYNLGLLGNVLSPLLMIYDASIDFQRESSSTEVTDTNTNTMNYALSTTFLRKSRIPLTLFGNRYTSDFNTESSETNTTGTLYGLDWSGKFVTLPKIHLRASREDTDSDDSKNQRTDYYLNMEKKLGPTRNQLYYINNSTKDTSGQTTSSTSLNFTNTTPLTTHTTINIGLSRGKSDSEGTSPSTVYGLSLGVTSDPSRFFNQSHYFTYFHFDSEDSTSDGNTYSGALQYKISRKISSSLNLSVNNTHTESTTSTEDSRDTGGNISITYNLTKRLYLSESVNYQHSETTSSSDTELSLTDRDYLNARTSLGYRRKFKWFLLSSSYGLGYVDDSDTEGGGGKGIEQAVSASLNQIDFNDYFLFNLSASDSRIKKTEGALHGRSDDFHFSTQNKKWKKYVQFNGSYKKTSTKSWQSAVEEKAEDLQFNAITKFIKRTNFSAFYGNSKSFSDTTGFSHSITEGVSANHQRSLLRGQLSVTLTFQKNDNTFTGGESSTTSASYSLRYSRSLFRRVGWSLLLQRSESDSDGSKIDSTSLNNMLSYSLRAWHFSLNHYYTIQHSTSDNRTDNRVQLRATRSFMRMF